MFKTIDLPAAERQPAFNILVDGRPVRAQAGQTVAMALLGSDVVPFRRTAVSGAPRAPLCLMGVCFECLVEIDGVPNRQSCLIPVAEGMTIRSQEGRVQLDAKEAASHE